MQHKIKVFQFFARSPTLLYKLTLQPTSLNKLEDERKYFQEIFFMSKPYTSIATSNSCQRKQQAFLSSKYMLPIRLFIILQLNIFWTLLVSINNIHTIQHDSYNIIILVYWVHQTLNHSRYLLLIDRFCKNYTKNFFHIYCGFLVVLHLVP